MGPDALGRGWHAQLEGPGVSVLRLLLRGWQLDSESSWTNPHSASETSRALGGGGQNQPRGCKMDAGRTSVAFEALASSLPSHSSPSRPLFSHPLLHLPPVDPHLYPQVPSQLLHLAPSCLSTARSPLGGGKPSILSRTSDLCVNTLWWTLTAARRPPCAQEGG